MCHIFLLKSLFIISKIYNVNVPVPVNLTTVQLPVVETQETQPGAAAKLAGLHAVASLNITIPVPPFPPV
jgi:hypothetical protein